MTTQQNLTLRRVIHVWWPLAASWLLMGAEAPAQSAVVARLADSTIHLAAYGGVVFPISLIVEAPIIMLLAASTALSKDWDSYQKLRRFMMVSGAVLTALHILIAFTPLYYWVIGDIIGAPDEIIEPARIGLMIMTPWTWSIAYRRFNQGVLIRFGHSQAVGVGTVVRLTANVFMLALGYALHTVPGVVVATSGMAAGVISEAIYIGWAVRPVRKMELKYAPAVAEPLTLRYFLGFYLPLAMTSLLTFFANPIGSAALSRMPEALDSLAVWPVVTGLVFLLRSVGTALNEVVVALLEEPGSVPILRRFTGMLAAATTSVLLLLAATPLARLWFQQVSALEPELAEMARLGVWVALPLPALTALQSWYQGAILHSRKTRGITESVVIYLVTIGLVLSSGVAWGRIPGLYVGLAAMGLSVLTQTAWLAYRSRPAVQAVIERDRLEPDFQPAD